MSVTEARVKGISEIHNNLGTFDLDDLKMLQKVVNDTIALQED